MLPAWLWAMMVCLADGYCFARSSRHSVRSRPAATRAACEFFPLHENGNVRTRPSPSFPVFGQKTVIDEKAPGEFSRGPGENGAGRVGHDLGLTRLANHRITAEQVLHRGGGDHSAWSALTAIPLGRSSPASPSTTRLMPNLAI